MPSKPHQLCFLACVVCCLWSGCSRPTEQQLLDAKADMLPVISYLEARIGSGQPIPEDHMSLETRYTEHTGKPYPRHIRYAAFGAKDFKLYRYVIGRISLWFLSFDDGGQGAGWWLDDESGRPQVPLWVGEKVQPPSQSPQ
jgi:hypothetical protein